MAIGTRQQPEKAMDRRAKCGDSTVSRRRLKRWQNKKARLAARRDPSAAPLPKYQGWEW